jgi:hypothetical protein
LQRILHSSVGQRKYLIKSTTTFFSYILDQMNRNAGANCCQFLASEDQIPNHSAQYHLTDLQEFQYILEEFNGISYRGRTPISYSKC